MTNKIAKPAAKASELPLVKARLAEVEARIAETREVCRASQGRDDRWIAAEKVLRQLEAERIDLMEREMQIQAGLYETAVKAKPATKRREANRMNLQEAFDAGFDAVKGYADRSFAAFEKRIASLEGQIAATEGKFKDLEGRIDRLSPLERRKDG